MKNEYLVSAFIVFVGAALLFTWFRISDAGLQVLGAFEVVVITKPVTAIMATTFIVGMMFFAIVFMLQKR